MKGFLEAVAEGYVSRYGDLSRLTFVMPNKRSGSFLLKELATYCGRPAIAPRIITISDMVAEVSGLVPYHRLTALFLLFDCYKRLAKSDDMEFERFSSWGETVLSDFNEIDMQMVDPDEIFKNISDLNSIRTDFLTEEQKEVARKYFGYSYTETLEGEEKFWKQFEVLEDVPGDTHLVRKKYYSLWQILRPLYSMFKERMMADGFTSAGGAFRESAEKIEGGFDPYPGEKLIFVGFNALTESERRMFKTIKKRDLEIDGRKESKADFVWDPVSEFLAENDDPSVRFVNYNMDSDRFPSPEWLDVFLQKSRPESAPNIEVVSVPSNVMQVKLIRNRLVERIEEIKRDAAQAKVAVVLPDENLLLPLLYSLPEDFPNPNLTMGYPLKHTPVVSFVGLLLKLQARIRMVKGSPEFFFEDVKDLLSHPYSRVIFGRGVITKFLQRLTSEKRITVGEEAFASLGENAGLVFKNIKEQDPETVIRYLSEILNCIRSGLHKYNDTFLRTKVESSFIDSFLRALVLLGSCIRLYDTNISAVTVFRLAERLIAGETVPFEGEPLKGLQVMGLLETRALDFNYVLMPSMNDKIMPRRGKNSTFIPNTLRMAYGMPPANYQEELFAYYFYRLAGRCKSLTLTYDARSNENRGGSVSRYILQLIYLADKVNVRQVEVRMDMPSIKRGTKTVEKTPEIASRLRLYYPDAKLEEGEKRKNISASALNNYGLCPLKFLYANVLEMYMEPEPIETIDAIDLGSIVHEVMERLYMRGGGKSGELLKNPIRIDEKFLDGLLSARTANGQSLITAEARRAVNHYHFKMKEENEMQTKEIRGSAAIVLDYIVAMVKSIIRYDKEKAPFLLHGCEIKETYEYTLPDGRKINFKMVIDRLDEVDGKLRIVDYKTGGVHLNAKSMDEIFDGTYGAKHILQLGVYALVLQRMMEKGLLEVKGWKGRNVDENLGMVIYNIPVIRKKELKTLSYQDHPEGTPRVAKTDIKSLRDLLSLKTEDGEDFKSLLDRMLTEIMDLSVPFHAELTEERCRYCDYKLRCENS